MKTTFHGGMCCGIKHIRGFNDPNHSVSAQAKVNLRSEDQYGHPVNTELDYFTDAAPEETELERLDRILAFIAKHRPAGIVEVVLAKGSYMDQPKLWQEILFDRGFKLVNSCKNSNSNNTIFVYHLNN